MYVGPACTHYTNLCSRCSDIVCNPDEDSPVLQMILRLRRNRVSDCCKWAALAQDRGDLAHGDAETLSAATSLSGRVRESRCGTICDAGYWRCKRRHGDAATKRKPCRNKEEHPNSYSTPFGNSAAGFRNARLIDKAIDRERRSFCAMRKARTGCAETASTHDAAEDEASDHCAPCQLRIPTTVSRICGTGFGQHSASIRWVNTMALRRSSSMDHTGANEDPPECGASVARQRTHPFGF